MATTVVSGRSRAGSTAGSLLRDQEPLEPQIPTPVPRLPRQPRGVPQSYASNDSGQRSRPVTPSAPGSNTDSYPPSRGTPQRGTRTALGRERDSERSSQADRDRTSQAERERMSQAEVRAPQPQPRIVIPEPAEDAAPSPRLRTPARASPRNQVSNNGLRPPSPSPPPPSASGALKRDPNARISYFDPANQAVSERLLEEGGAPDTNESTLASVEDMLEGFEWQHRTGSASGGAADQIEARLKDELLAPEKANIHSFVESDDRLALVLKFIDDALGELNDMDSMIQSYKVHLNAVGDDISYIQGQNRGLQVQNQNQRALLTEIEQLLQTVHVDRDALLILTQESLEGQRGIKKLEEAAAELYRALLAGRDRDMAATIERLAEYKTHNQQFCTRLLEFLTVMFGYQSDSLIEAAEKSRQSRTQPTLLSHKPMEDYLGRYCGLMLYLREMDEGRYSKVCASYFSTASELHSKEARGLFMKYLELVQRGPEDDENTFAQQPQGAISRAGGTVRRAGTMVGRSPVEKKSAQKPVDGEMPGFEAFDRAMAHILTQIHAEETFISDFLHISDSSLTFADYMNLDSYFKRQAARSLGLSDATIKLVRGAMDLIFGFLPLEVKSWVEGVSKRDTLQLVGIIAVLQRRVQEAQEQNQMFVDRLLVKSLQRLNVQHQRQVDEQLHAIEQTKLTTKKRKGVAHFIRYFPTYVGRVEAQLINAQGLEIRRTVDTSYERIVSAMFDALQQMAKMDGADGKDKDPDDKGVLNYHVIMIENMHHFVADMTQLDLGAVRSFVSRAEEIYDRELSAYVTFVLRRPMAKIIDYFDAVERLLQTTAPSEVHNNGSFNRSALKKVVKEYDQKDMRRNVDGLYKRVEKHFADADETSTTTAAQGAAGPVLIGVWKACEEELIRLTDKWVKLIAQCYAESGVNLEYTTGDVRAAFRRHRG